MKVAHLCLTFCNSMDYTVHGILQARILEWVAFPFSKGSSQPRDWTQISNIAVNSEPQGKPKNTGVVSLSLLQWIFPTQEFNRGLLHYRWILNQFSYQGSQIFFEISHYSLRQAVYLTLNICLIINECIHVGEGKDDSRKLVLTVKGKDKLWSLIEGFSFKILRALNLPLFLLSAHF